MKILCAILFLLLSINSVSAQRLLFGQKGVEVSTGVHAKGKLFENQYFLKAGIVSIRTNGNYQFLYMDYSIKKHEFEKIMIPVENYMIEGGYSFSIFNDWKKTISFNLGLGAAGGYEQVNKGDSTLSNGAVLASKDSFIYGGLGNLTLELYLGDKFVFITRGQAKYLLGTSMENFRPSLGLGLRFIF